MELVLRQELELFVDEQVRAGCFPTREAVIEAALDEFRASMGLDEVAVAAINEGLEQADRGEGIDLETFRARFCK